MNTLVILLLTLGLVSVIANPISKQTTATDNKKPPLSESSESETKREVILNNETEQNNAPENENCETNACLNGKVTKDVSVELLIEDEVIDPVNYFTDTNPVNEFLDVSPENDFSEVNPANDFTEVSPGFAEVNLVNDFPEVNPVIGAFSESELDVVPEDDFNAFPDEAKVKDEIMETAAGIVPFTIFRRRNKHKPTRRLATRRFFRRKPMQHRIRPSFYPYFYHPHAFYRPSSSLRFY